MYLLVSFIIAFVTIFGLGTVGAVIAKENVRKTAGWSFIVSIAYALLLNWIYWLAQVGFYGPTPFLGGILFGGVIGAITAFTCTDEEGVSLIPPLAPVALYVVYAVIFVYFGDQADFFGNSKKKATYIGEVPIIDGTAIDFSNDSLVLLEEADPAHLFLTPDSVADGKTNDALSAFKLDDPTVTPGSRYTVGENTVQFVDGQTWHIYEMKFGNVFKWGKDKIVPGFLRIDGENPNAIGEAVQYNKQGEPIRIKYLNSAHFGNKAERYIRRHGYMNAILRDWTFEPDDNWDPYYTVSILERHAGYVGYTLKSVIVFDVQTGDIQEYAPEELPAWVDRGMPKSVLDEQVTNWAKFQYTGAWQNTFNKSKKKLPTAGWYFTYNKAGRCQWISGITSAASDDALTGFTFSDGPTGKTKYVKKNGVTEKLAYEAAAKMWAHTKGTVKPALLRPYNLYGEETYVIPMIFGRQFAGVSLVSMNNKDIQGSGETKEEALREYRVALSRKGSRTIAPTSSAGTMTLEGIISRIGTPFSEQETTYWPFLLKGVDKYFQATYSVESPEVPYMRAGDAVTIKFIDTDEATITCIDFDIVSVTNAVSGTPEQARYDEAQDHVSQETERINDLQRRDALLESDAMKDVDPKALEEFLKSQQNK